MIPFIYRDIKVKTGEFQQLKEVNCQCWKNKSPKQSSNLCLIFQSKIEKVTRGVQGEKTRQVQEN